LRLVVVQTTPHEKRGGPQSNGQLLLATNILDLPAWIIALIYRYRWTIEVFFRFFKHGSEKGTSRGLKRGHH
jgi:hypothetical protein